MLGLVLAGDRAMAEAPGGVQRGFHPGDPLTQGSAGRSGTLLTSRSQAGLLLSCSWLSPSLPGPQYPHLAVKAVERCRAGGFESESASGGVELVGSLAVKLHLGLTLLPSRPAPTSGSGWQEVLPD